MGTRVLNPAWQRDELILALEPYDRHGPCPFPLDTDGTHLPGR